MGYKSKVFIIILSLLFIGAIKNYYGGIVKIRLNEPTDFIISSTNYSDMVFYSLIYENFFYLNKNGEIYSNIFKEFKYSKENRSVVLKLKKNLKFSNGTKILSQDVIKSFNSFIGKKYGEAKRLGKVTKSISKKNEKIILALNYDFPDIMDLLTVPQLVITSSTPGAFSGPFYPVKWVKNKNMILYANKLYAGGIAYLDKIQIDFENYFYPDIFLSKPGTGTNGSHKEYNSGVYQNYYISFPKGNIGKNTRIAFYSILKAFFTSQGYPELNVLTSEAESPLSINIKKFTKRKIRTILTYSNIKVYIISTLKNIESEMIEFFKRYRINIEIVFVKHSDLSTLLKDTSVKYLIVEKVFHNGISLSEKIKRIVREMSFIRFDEHYFALIEQLNEIINLRDSELLMEQISRIIQKIISDGYLLPISQKQYSLYLKKKLKGIIIDYYGRPIIHKCRYEFPLNESKEENNGK